jgi:hypothetical protein
LVWVIVRPAELRWAFCACVIAGEAEEGDGPDVKGEVSESTLIISVLEASKAMDGADTMGTKMALSTTVNESMDGWVTVA